MVRLLTILLLVFTFGTGTVQLAFCQRAKIDSLETRQKVAQGKEKLTLLVELSRLYAEKEQPGKALSYAKEAFIGAQKMRDNRIISGALLAIGGAYESDFADAGRLNKAFQEYRKAVSLSEQYDLKQELAQGLSSLGNVYVQKKEYLVGREHFEKAQRLSESIGNAKLTAELWGKVGDAFAREKKYDEAIAAHKRAMHVRENLGDVEVFLTSISAIADLYYENNDYPHSIEYYKRGLEASQKIEQEKRRQTMFVFYENNLARVYAKQGDYTKAKDHYQEGLALAEKNNYSIGVLGALNGLGAVYGKLGDFDKALEYRKRVLKIAEERKQNKHIAVSLRGIGNLYADQDKFEEALDFHSQALEYYMRAMQAKEDGIDEEGLSTFVLTVGAMYNKLGKYNEAIKFMDKGMGLAQKVGQRDEMKKTYRDMADAYAKLKDYQKAYEFHQLYSNVKDSLYNEEFSKQISDLQVRFETEKKLALANKERELQAERIKVLNKDKELQKALIDKFNNDRKLQAAEVENLRKEQEIQAQRIKLLEKNKQLQEKELEQQRLIRNSIMIVLILLFALAVIIYNRYRVKREANKMLGAQNDEIKKVNGELEQAYEELNTMLDEVSLQKEALSESLTQVRHQKDVIEEKNQEIEDSIRYAKRIQGAILPPEELLQSALPQHFIYYRPKDIVSGDFYWFSRQSQLIYIAAVDCTGHGVPGAFMSVVGYNLLNQVVNELGYQEPEKILNEVDRRLRIALRQDNGEGSSRDGMDLILCVYNPESNVLKFSGANRPLYHFTDGEFIEYKGGKFPIGGGQFEDKVYGQHEIILNPNDRVYLFTDGIVDQFGGPLNKKFGSRRLLEFLKKNQHLSMREQHPALAVEFEKWRGEGEQIDDVTFIGIEAGVPKKTPLLYDDGALKELRAIESV